MVFGFLDIALVAVVAVVLLAIAGKSEPDPLRERPTAIYLSAVMLVGVGLLLVATFLTANGLVELTDTSPTGFDGFESSETVEVEPRNPFDDGIGSRGPRPLIRPGPAFEQGSANHDDDISQVIGGLIAAAVALAVIRFHAPKLQEVVDNSSGPGARVYARGLYIACGVTLVTALGAASVVVYSVYGMIAPDTAGPGEVTDALRTFLSAAALAAAAGYVFHRCWTRSEDLAAVVRASVGTATAPPPAPATPTEPESEAEPESPPPTT